MTGVYSWIRLFYIRIYVAIALVIAIVFSPLVLSFVPILLLLAYLYLWRWPISAVINLLEDYFIFFTIAILLSPVVGHLFSFLISLPILVLINHGLEETAESLAYRNAKRVRGPTSVCLALLLMAVLVLGVSSLLGSLSLILACAAIIVYFGILYVAVLRGLPLKPVEETKVQQRMVAGSEGHLQIELTAKTEIGGLLFVESPYEWLKVSPNILSLKQKKLVIEVSLSPTLSGPSMVKLNGHAMDRWGLIQTRFELEPIRLYVIPRARYAAWVANKYLDETKVGTLPLISNIGALKPLYGLRRGIEYYGSQLYQPGDSLKNIDWKHSLKYNEMITKEFAEFHGRSAIILINLAVGDAEEADKLAYSIIVTAISLAQNNIPAALAAYSHEGVKLSTPTLQPRQLLVQSLKIVNEIVTFTNPVKYLNPPDVARLRTNISRIGFVQSEASEVLVRLLRLEYENLENNARLNPATKALSEAFTKADKQSDIVIISRCNHDAEALAFNIFSFARKGKAVITV
jgi:uncharacterized protein (DUF58 family)